MQIRRGLIKLGVVHHAVVPLETEKMILVFDMRTNPSRTRTSFLSRHEDQWQSYLRGECKVQFFKGKINDIFFNRWDQETMFSLDLDDQGKRKKTFTRMGDISNYVVGRRVIVEQTFFYGVLFLTGPHCGFPDTTRVWIEKENQ
jgi:hypothetical protein